MKLKLEKDDHAVDFILREQFIRWGVRLQEGKETALLAGHEEGLWIQPFAFFLSSFVFSSRQSLDLSSSLVVHNSSQLPKAKIYSHTRWHLAPVVSLSGLLCFTLLRINVAGCCWMHTGVSFMLGLKVLLSTSWFQLVPENGLICSIFTVRVVKWPVGGCLFWSDTRTSRQ